MKPFITVAWLLVSVMMPLGTVNADFFFPNPTPILIPTRGLANPYPSAITVSGITAPVTNFTLSLNGFSHRSTDDVGAVVVSPTGTIVKLFSGAAAAA